jgi:LacI family transcriptional regulator
MVTLADVAAEAGVSRSTVSLVLNDRAASVGLSAATCDRVRAVATRLGYRRNALAHAMVTGHNPWLGALVPAVDAPPVVACLSGAMAVAAEQGQSVQLARVAPDDAPDDLDRCTALRPAGLLACCVGGAGLARLAAELPRLGTPLAVIDESLPVDLPGLGLAPDLLQGARQVIDHLVGLGHRRIALLPGAPWSDGQGWTEAYHRAFAEHLLPLTEPLSAPGPWAPEAMRDLARELLKGRKGRPTAVCCGCDEAALMVIRAARKLDLRVPKELSVVGCGDLLPTELADPALTTLNLPWQALGAEAARWLAAPPANGSREARVLPVSLALRKSTSRAPG